MTFTRCSIRWLPLWFVFAASLPAVTGVQVVDDLGRQIELPQPARRIVSLAPHLTELLFTVGAGERIVGTVDYSDYPEPAKRIPRIGGYSQVSIEAVTALQPDLVVAWQTGNPPRQVDKLRDLGFVVYISEPRRMEDIPSSIERLGHLAGRAGVAGEAAAAFRQRHDALQRRYASLPVVDVFYEIWNKPLLTVNGHHLISDVIHLCGGRNVYRDLPNLVPTIGVESVLHADPEVIIASGMNEQRPEWLADWRQWRDLRAVKNGNLYFIPPDILQRHTVRILEGAERMCRALEQVRNKRR